MKRTICVVLALVLALSLALAGCQSNSTSSSGSSSDSQSASGSGSESQELEPVVLEYYCMGTVAKDNDMVYEEINKYLTEKINATVNMHWLESADYNTKMSAIIGAGQTFDMLYTARDYVNFATNAQNGAFMELDDLLTEYAPDLVAAIPEYVLEGGRVNGKIYGVPSYKDVANTYAYAWNTDLAQEVGLDESKQEAPWKYMTDLDERVREFKAIRDEKYPELADLPMLEVETGMEIWWSWDNIIGGVATNVGGIDFFKDQGSGEKVFNAYATPEYTEILKFIRTWVDDNIFPVYQAEWDSDYALRVAGKVPVRISNGLVAAPDYYFSNQKVWKCKIVRSDIAVSTTSYLQAAMTAISQTSKNPERAMMYMNIQYTDPWYATTSRFGIEGTHYNIVKDDAGNDRLDFTDTENADGLETKGFYNWYGATAGNLFKCILPLDQPDDLFDKLQQMNEDASNYETNIGFVFDQTNVANEVAACAGVIDEYHLPLMNGAYTLDEIDAKVAEFNQKLEANGIQKIIDEAQKQLNEWRAAQGKTVYEG